MVKVVSIQQTVIYFLAILKMDGEMGNFCVLMSVDQGLYHSYHFYWVFFFCKLNHTSINFEIKQSCVICTLVHAL